MKLAFTCPYYGPTYPLVGFGQRANLVNAAAAGHIWVDDYSSNGMQHREACESMVARGAEDPRIEGVFWTEHDVVLPPNAVETLTKVMASTGADVVTGIVFRRSPPHPPMVSKLEPLTPEQYERCKVSKSPKLRELAQDLSYEELAQRLFTAIQVVDTKAEPFQADTASMGCLLISKETLVRVAHYEDLFSAEKHLSIDNQFFRHVCQKEGLKLWCAPSILCGHLGDPEIITWEHWKRSVLEIIAKCEAKLDQGVTDGA